jgi:hypothetical protein
MMKKSDKHETPFKMKLEVFSTAFVYSYSRAVIVIHNHGEALWDDGENKPKNKKKNQDLIKI